MNEFVQLNESMESLETDYYLFQCNMNCDIENNVGELEIPVFTEEHVDQIDRNYKQNLPRGWSDPECYEENGLIDETTIVKMTNSFEINDLFFEHISYIVELRTKVNSYNKLYDKTERLCMYFHEIVPILEKDRTNLKEMLSILSQDTGLSPTSTYYI
jgi:hypothetical protein